MNFTTINRVTLRYQLDGTPDGTPLVLINSLGSDLRIWDDVVTHFADRYRILRYDKRGHGQSSCSAAPYTIGDHARDLAGLLDHAGFQDVVLIGVSVGGMILRSAALGRKPSKKCSKSKGFWLPIASERMLAEYPTGVLDFGAGHSHFQDNELFARVQRALAPCKNVVLLLPSSDLDKSLHLLRERSKTERGWDWSTGGYDFIEH